MQCPVCKNSMVILELDKVEIDYCPACKGIWLDSGELELLIEDYSKNNSSNFRLVNDLPEKKYRCPICNKKMNKVEYANSKIIIDKCKNDHGLWFDKGELNLLLSANEINQNNKVLTLLKSIFGD
ncbi:MAG: zf-TFIIB domain-containing protein [Ignavibacteriaceae bacterium]